MIMPKEASETIMPYSKSSTYIFGLADREDVESADPNTATYTDLNNDSSSSETFWQPNDDNDPQVFSRDDAPSSSSRHLTPFNAGSSGVSALKNSSMQSGSGQFSIWAAMVGTPLVIPNEQYFTSGELWGYYGNTTSPANNFGSQAAEAWAQNQIGSTTNVIGVIDSGIDYTHLDLYPNVWLNQFELPAYSFVDVNADGLITFRDLNNVTNAAFVSDLNGTGYIDAGDLLADSRWADGADNDGNGFIDDLIGWDFVNNDNDPMDDHGHGTHVSGIIGAVGGNGVGVTGVNWDVQIMPLKFLDATNFGWVTSAVNATEYFTNASLQDAGRSNFVATNNSWSSNTYEDPALSAAISRAADQDILYVAAAGNGGANGVGYNVDLTPDFPSGFSTTATSGYEAVISVAALTDVGALASFSNYGLTSVDIAAPGQGILSTFPGNQYALFSGTSMATAFVTGAAALYAAQNPNARANDIRTAILSSSAPTASLNGSIATGGRLDIGQLLGVDPTSQPAPDLVVTDLVVSGFTLTYLLSNVGQSAIAPTTTAIYLSTDASITSSDTLIATTVSASLGSANSRTETTSFIFPDNIIAGQYYIGVIANYDGSVRESALANNASLPQKVFIGTTGANNLNGTAQADLMYGLSGDDVYVFNNLQDVAVELAGGGVDTILASIVIDALGTDIENLTLTGSTALRGTGNASNNTITGNGAANTLIGLAGDDVLNGGANADAMFGGVGNDIYIVDNSADRAVEALNEGLDEVRSSVTISALASNVENLTLTGARAIRGTGNELNNVITGNAAANTLNGLAGNDWLFGGSGNDLLLGGAGDDSIIGGPGRDTMTGGAGADFFIFRTLLDLGATSSTQDTITDFTRGQDKIDLAGIDANTSITGVQAFSYIGSASFSGAGQLRYSQGILYGNINSNPASDFQIALSGSPAISAGDLIL